MVVGLLIPPEIDKVFHALADATRRDIVCAVLVQDQSVSALAGRYPMSVPAVQKHVAVLEEAGVLFDHDEDDEAEIEEFREFLNQVQPEDFASE